MKTDHLFYYIFSCWPELLFTLANIKKTTQNYTFTSEEIKQASARIDGIFKPTTSAPDSPLIFSEIQMQKDPKLYARLFKEIFLYLHIHEPQNPWHAVVIYPSKTQESNHLKKHYQYLLDGDNIHIIYLKDLLKKLHNTKAPGLDFLRMIVATKPQAKKQAKQLLKNSKQKSQNNNLTASDYLNLIETILVHKFPKMTWEEIRIMLNFDYTGLKHTQAYQDIKGIGIKEGEKLERKRAIQRQRRALKRQNKEHKQRQIILAIRFLTRQIGELPNAFKENIAILSLEKINLLIEDLLDLSTLDDLQKWLQTNDEITETRH